MEKKLSAILLLVLSVLLCCGSGCADSGGLAIAGKASTLGFGGELTTGISSNVNARVGINMLDLNFDDEFEDIEYDAGLDFSSFSALVDWYLFNSGFRVTGGLIAMDHEISLDATPTVSEEIGGVTYTAAEIGTLSGDIEVDDLAPYVGIGWGDAMDPGRRWGFYCDFGVAFTNSPDVELSANGTLASNAAFQANLAKERKDIEDDLEPFRFYPVISVGLFYRF
ncbi:MAG: hypothetical protein ABIF19_03450 [Planctomycetota bacterium]